MADGIKLLTVKELAHLLGVHERTCWRLAAMAEDGHGDFPRPLRVGPKTLRWRLVDVEAYLAALACDMRPLNTCRFRQNALAPRANRR